MQCKKETISKQYTKTQSHSKNKQIKNGPIKQYNPIWSFFNIFPISY